MLLAFLCLGAPAAAATWTVAQAQPSPPARPLPLFPPARTEGQPLPPLPGDPAGVLQPLPQPGRGVGGAAPPPGAVRELLQQPSRATDETAKPGEVAVAPVSGLPVDRLDPEASGTLTDENGGLGTDLWAGTRRSLIERLLPVLPTGLRSRAMRELMRRLLLTAAHAPAGQPSGSAAPMSFLAMRLERLLAMGAVDDAAQLLRRVPSRDLPAPLARSKVETLFLADDVNGACGDVAARVGGTADGFWQKALIFCQAVSRDHDKAALGVELLREMGDRDRLFFVLVDALAGHRDAKLAGLETVSPLHLAMMRAAEVPLPAELSAAADPGVLGAVTHSPKAPLETRIKAAERAVAAAVLPAAVLAGLYDQVTFTEEQLDNPLVAVEELAGSVARALLFRAAKRQAVPTARAEVLNQLWTRAADPVEYVVLARLTAPLVQELRPGPELAWLAADAGRGLYAAGRPQAARVWFDLVLREAPVSPEAAAVLARLWPLARIATPEPGVPWDASLLDAWREATLADETAEPGAAVAKVGLLLTMLDALGEPIIGGDWERLYDDAPIAAAAMPPAWVWFGLRSAAERRLRGETVLFGLLGIGDAELATLDPVLLHHVIVSLRLVGLDREARALALEAAIANGI
jgi:hypothetical protein